MDSEIIRQLAKSGLLPQEEMLEVKTRDSKLFIGIPLETGFQEIGTDSLKDGASLCSKALALAARFLPSLSLSLCSFERFGMGI